MRPNPEKQNWIVLAVEIKNIHISHLKTNEHWRVQDTAARLNRSIGSISQYLLIASWLKTHENQLRRCETMKEALALIHKLERARELDA